MNKKFIKYIFSIFILPLCIILLSGIFHSSLKKGATAEGEIEIYSIEDLYAVRDDLSASYILMNDLDFDNLDHYETYDSGSGTWLGDDLQTLWSTGNGWIPIGNMTTNFVGSFDGNGYTISNLYINRSTETYIGLFGVLSSQGVLQNLGVINIGIEGDEYVGGLTGSNSGTMSNVYTSGTVAGTSKIGGLIGSSSGTVSDSYSLCIVDGDGRIGGLIGENLAGGIITNVSWNGLLTATGYYIGGLVGVNNINATINNSFSTGDIIGGSYVGGFVGTNEGSIINSHSDTNYNITQGGYTEYTGGFVGFNDEGSIDNCHSSGEVIASLDAYHATFVGGFVGYNMNRNTGGIYNSFTTTSTHVIADDSVGGLVGFNDSGVIVNSYSLSSVEGNKNIGGLTGYDYESDITNSYYNYELVKINNVEMVTNGALGDQLFNDWLNNNLSLNIDDYLELSNGYYNINNVNDLKILLYSGENENLSFQLTTNLDLDQDSRFYIPKFRANLNGQGHVISNLYVDLSSNETEPASFIGDLSSEGSISNIGLINVQVYGSRGAGGLIGYNYGEISNVYTTGLVNGTLYVGGIAGGNWDGGTITKSYSATQIGTKGGGLVGSGTVLNVTNSFWDTEISGKLTSIGGTGKTSLEMQTIDTYTTLVSGELDEQWDIVLIENFNPSAPSTWYIREGSDYPRLSGEYLMPFIETTSPTDVSDRGATLRGELRSLGENIENNVFFQYRKIGGVWVNTPQFIKTSTGDFNYIINNLSPNTQYEYRTVVQYGTSFYEYGEVNSFETKAAVLPTVVITDIGLINDVLDKESISYYFTSTKPVIKGITESLNIISFEYDGKKFSTQAREDGTFSFTLSVSRGTNDIKYYSTDLYGISSAVKELTLIVGTENFPDWLLERLGLIETAQEEDIVEEDNEDEEKESGEEQEQAEQNDQGEEITPPTNNTQKIKFTDKRGNPLTEATVEIDGNRYVTNSEGEIEIENLGNNTYTANVRTKDGKEYSIEILGVGDENGSIVVEVDEDTGVNWKNIIIYSGIGLVLLIVILIIFTKKKAIPEDF